MQKRIKLFALILLLFIIPLATPLNVSAGQLQDQETGIYGGYEWHSNSYINGAMSSLEFDYYCPTSTVISTQMIMHVSDSWLGLVTDIWTSSHIERIDNEIVDVHQSSFVYFVKSYYYYKIQSNQVYYVLLTTPWP